jgi:hypothetical protein
VIPDKHSLLGARTHIMPNQRVASFTSAFR